MAKPVQLDKELVQKFAMGFTNYQRNQWAKAGYPKTKAALEKFSRLRHHKHRKKRARL